MGWHAYNSIMVELPGSNRGLRGIANPPVNLQDLAAQLKVLAEPRRLLILHLLMEGVQCNCELGDALDMPANLISFHLRALREAGLITAERDVLDARWIYYSINRPALENLVRVFGAFFDPARIQTAPARLRPTGRARSDR